MDQQLFNVKEAAQILGVSRWTVSSMIKSGELPFIPWRRSKKAKRISKQSIEAYVRKHTVTSKEEFKREMDGRRAR